MNEEMSTDDLRSIGEMLATNSNLSESQALVYAFRAIGEMDRQETVMKLDANPSTLDTHFQRAKDKMETARLQTHLGEIYRGDSLHVREGMTFPTVPEQWQAMPVQFERDTDKEVRLFELPDNRVVKCVSEHNVRGVDIEAVGGFKFKTRNPEWEQFERYFEDEVGINTDLSATSKLVLGASYQTMVEYAVTQWLQGKLISPAYKYMKVISANLAESPSWVEVNSNDELVAATISENLEAKEDLQDLKDRFLEIFDVEKHGLLPAENGNSLQYNAHVAQAFCRATGTKYPLTFDWDIDTRKNREYNSLDELQSKSYYERNYWVMAYENRGYRLDMIPAEIDLRL